MKIIGAGSIGNHLAHASRQLNWVVDIVDVDRSALERTRNSIYPTRYGQWDTGIGLYDLQSAPVGGYDMIIIGTPPDTHLSIAMKMLEERPRCLMIEKPVCCPDLDGAERFYEESKKLGVAVFVGYDHVVGKASKAISAGLRSHNFGAVLTLDVEFREHWGGIFRAHPWLSGPSDSYLGFMERGGGASGEHSHALNLWQHFALEVGAGKICEVAATLDVVKDENVHYDRICAVNLKTESGFVGRCIQDVVTRPSRKFARVQFENGYLEWHSAIDAGEDLVHGIVDETEKIYQRIQKTRPDDFIDELTHIQEMLESNYIVSPISIERGLDTMLVISAVNLSSTINRAVKIDYARGYCREALHID